MRGARAVISQIGAVGSLSGYEMGWDEVYLSKDKVAWRVDRHSFMGFARFLELDCPWRPRSWFR